MRLPGTSRTVFTLALAWFGSVHLLAAPIDFKKQIEPIFADRCHQCHGPDKQKNNFRLDRKSSAMEGGDSGASILPNKSAESRLYKYIAGLDPKIVMPAKGPRLSSNEVALIQAWIDGGASWPDDLVVDDRLAKGRHHWAFQAPVRPVVPKIRNSAWVRTPIDAFIGQQHEQRGLVPNPEAQRRALLRRVSLDLLGLPPTPEEMDTFLNDQSAKPYEKLVERVLASRHYGERWGRHWLDLARWAESDSYEANSFRSTAWRYRDYVIKSFNDDKPYNFFLRQQIAGDELQPYSDENFIATGFLAAARLNNNEEDKAIQRNEVLVDIANATASATLGITLNCAQCHDHKFDPFTIRDYYRWHGFFARGQLVNVLLADASLWKTYETTVPAEFETAKKLRAQLVGPVRERLIEEVRGKLSPASRAALEIPDEKRSRVQARLAKEAAKELQISKEKIEKALTDDDQKLLKELDKKIAKIEKDLEERKPQTWAFYSPPASPHKMDALPPRGMFPLPYDPQKLRETKPALFKRGDVHRPADEVTPGPPEILQHGAASGGSSRSELIDWLTSPTNPLVARVWVNFIWQQHFGVGLVASTGDFGLQGTPPANPELLDWLACELVSSGWSTRHIQRLILLSSAYCQSADPQKENLVRDPDNKYLWRFSPRRLEAEAIRDSALAVSGELDRTLGGESIRDEDQKLRRSIYLRQKRGELSPVQALFDAPSANESCPRRHVSTVALQPLYLLNSEFMLKRAAAFARSVYSRAGEHVDTQIEVAFRLALGRMPAEAELNSARTLIESHGQANESRSGPSPALTQFCQAMLNLDEFCYLE